MLESKVDLNPVTLKGDTPLSLASESSDLFTIDLLLDQKGKLNQNEIGRVLTLPGLTSEVRERLSKEL